MNNEEQSLEFRAGIGTAYVQAYKNIRVDNGDDKYGTNATGEFVIKTGKKDNFEREQLGNEMEVVVLLQRAKLRKTRNNGQETDWYSDEFNPLNVGELIKIRKPDIKGYVEMNYKTVLAHYPKIKGENGPKNQFNYETILYVKDVEREEIFRLGLTGGSMRTWIEFKGGKKKSLWETTVIMNIKPVKGEKYFNIEFVEGVDVDAKKTRLDVGDVMSQLPANKTIEIEAPVEQKKLSEINKEIDEVVQEEQPEEIPVVETEKEEGEVLLSDIPF